MSAGSFGKHTVIRSRVQLGSKTFSFSPLGGCYFAFCLLSGLSFLNASACITHTSHTHTRTQAETHLPVGAAVDNSRLSAPEASAGTVVFMLKQQQRRFTASPLSPSFPQPLRPMCRLRTGFTLPRLQPPLSLWKSPL